MARPLAGLIVVTTMFLGVTARADEEALAGARAALGRLDYSAAREGLEAALREGNHPRVELLEIYALRGEVAAVLDGEQAAEREFRHVLVLDPGHAPPARDTPTFRTPFASAQAWQKRAGALTVQSVAEPGEATVRIMNDPLAMAARMRVHAARDGAYTNDEAQGFHARVTATSCYVDVLDRHGNVLVTLGSADAPLSISAPADPTRRAWYRNRTGWALLGSGVALGITGAVLLGLSSHAAHDARADATRDAYLHDRDLSRRFDISGGTLLGMGGGLVASGSVVFALSTRR